MAQQISQESHEIETSFRSAIGIQIAGEPSGRIRAGVAIQTLLPKAGLIHSAIS